jgi:predicted N-acetyltransferase YhbS
MVDELASTYGVRLCAAVLKAANFRSVGLLQRLGFTAASARQVEAFGAQPDERVMVKTIGDAAEWGPVA